LAKIILIKIITTWTIW